MKKKHSSYPQYRPVLLLLILISLIYSNTLDCSWQLDDYQNIITNSHIQIHSLDWDAIKNSFYASPGTYHLDRPFAFFTFALNWYWCQDQVDCYHIVNILIHIFTATFLFFTILRLFQTPKLKNVDPRTVYFAALMSAALWAIHPIQIQAVTYIVQRMASLAALFYISGIFFYLNARLTSSAIRRFVYGLLCGVSFLLGIASKNNAILLPVFLLIIEFVFFQDLSQKKIRKNALLIFFGMAVIVTVAGIFLFMDGNIGKIFDGYKNRPFSLSERLLTQPRILLFYFSQIIYPTLNRFSIAHDVDISTSLFTPWTTLPSAFLILLCLVLSVWRINKNPVLAFAILFFFGNHVIESSIIPLELIFEHRNYLPTLFLFLPVSLGIKKGLDYYSDQKPMFFFLVFSVCAMMTGIGTSTYLRNFDWRSPRTLWEDAVEKAPQSARPFHNLAWGYYQPTGQIDKAIELYQTAIHKKFEKKKYKADSFSNIASIYYRHLNNYEKAIQYVLKALEINPNHNTANLLLGYAYGKTGKYEDALAHLSRLIERYPNHLDFLYLKGLILLKIDDTENALKFFHQCLIRIPNNWKYLRETGYCYTQTGNYPRGRLYLKMALEKAPDQPATLLALTENCILAGRLTDASKYIDQWLDIVGVANVEKVLLREKNDRLSILASYSAIVPLMAENLTNRSQQYTEIAERTLLLFACD